MDYLYIYVPLLVSLPTGDWAEVDADVPGFDSSSEVQLSSDVSVYRYFLSPVLPLQFYLYQELSPDLEAFIEDGIYLFIVSRGQRRDELVQEFLTKLS